MASVDFKPNMAGIREFMKSPGVRAQLGREARAIADGLNAGVDPELKVQGSLPPYGSAVNYHKNVAVGRVFTASFTGRIDEARNHPIERHCD